MDENEKEVVVMGKGIGFQKKAGDSVDEGLIEKVFHLPKEHASQFENLIADMPYEYIQLAKEIIQYAKDNMNKNLNRNIYITLTDHLNFAIQRQQQGIAFQNALLWEIRKYYSDEFRIGLKALEMVKEKVNIELPEDEAGFIALHLVNAELDGDMKHAANMPGMIKDMINIVRYTFGIELDETTLSYERFVTHLKFFIQRAVQGECYDVDDVEFIESIRTRYPKEYECALKMKEYMDKRVNYQITTEELAYLTIHIARVNRRNPLNPENGLVKREKM